MSRVPGNFTHQHIGRRKSNIEGWRDFDPLHPEAAVYGDGTSHALTQLDGNVTVNANREIVATFKDVISAHAGDLPGADVYSIPLRNKDGTPVTFADSFTLRTQIELISTSGDIGADGQNKTRPFFGLGFGQHADVGDSTNHYIANGYWLGDFATGSGVRIVKFKTTAADTHSTVLANDSGNRTDNLKHMTVDYFVGPCIGATETDDDNVIAITWVGQNASGSLTRNSQAQMGEFEMNNANGYIDVDTQVYLYAFFGSQNSTNGSNDPAVVTCRLRYLLNANVGKAGTGAA
jgi:hypothetical protein